MEVKVIKKYSLFLIPVNRFHLYSVFSIWHNLSDVFLAGTGQDKYIDPDKSEMPKKVDICNNKLG